MSLIRFVEWGIRICQTMVEGSHDEGALISGGCAIARVAIEGGKRVRHGDSDIYGIWHFLNGKYRGKTKSSS